MIIAGTGHRSGKLGGYDERTFDRLVALAEAALKKYQPECVISGMALGWDQALAQAALNLKIAVIAAVPCRNQDKTWPEASKRRYREMLQRVERVEYISNAEYHPSCMQRRNEWMVDKADMILALWDGSSGGTANCLRYAKEVGKPFVNLWSSWVKYK